MRILLIGNPNVGKSVLFSRLTGLRVIASNYPGTTVGYTQGTMRLGDATVEVVDAPGAYTLDPTCEAEKIAVEVLATGDTVVNVVDATNLERNLYLTLQLLERKVPMVVALNLWDDTAHRGIHVDLDKLRASLKVPVVPTVAVTGEGVRQLAEAIPAAAAPGAPARSRDERWAAVGDILRQVQRLAPRRHTWRDRLADASVQPLSGALLAGLVLAASFLAVRLVGEGLIAYLLDPLFDGLWAPVLDKLSALLGGDGLLHDVVVGKRIQGKMDFVQSFGLLSSGLYIEFGMVLPYLVAFYLVLGILEDTGYLPRLAVLMDTAMHRMGLHGYAIIPTLLGLGCNVPGILATRILESRKQRFIACTLISIAVPCAALQAMVVGVVGEYGARYVAIVYGSLLLVWLGAGVALRYAVQGFAPELLIEIPPYRRPQWRAVLRKLWIRVSGFLREAVPIILAAVLVVNIAYYLGVFEAVARFTAPVITGLWGLPQEAVTAILVGLLRKDVAVGMLAPLALTAQQATVAAFVLAMFFPCIATFAVLGKELGLRDAIKATAIMLAVAAAAGALLRAVL